MAGFWAEALAQATGELIGIFTAGKMGLLGKVAGKVVGNEAFQKMAAEKIGGIFIDPTGKSSDEELLTRDLKNFLDAQTRKQFEKLLEQLQADPDKGKDRLTAFRVFLAQGMVKKMRRTNPPKAPKSNKKNGEEEDPNEATEASYTKLDLEWAKGLVNDILAIPENDYDKRKAYIELEGGFATMKKTSKAKILFASIDISDDDYEEIKRRYEESKTNKQKRRTP
jgi:hypothetical protein